MEYGFPDGIGTIVLQVTTIDVEYLIKALRCMKSDDIADSACSVVQLLPGQPAFVRATEVETIPVREDVRGTQDRLFDFKNDTLGQAIFLTPWEYFLLSDYGRALMAIISLTGAALMIENNLRKKSSSTPLE